MKTEQATRRWCDNEKAVMKVSYQSDTMDGAALMSPVTVSRISMAFCSSSFLYSATMLDSARLSRIRILRRIRLLNFINLRWN